MAGPPKLATLEEVEPLAKDRGRTGYLEKEGGMFKNSWDRRFFVLTDAGVLYWFKEAKPKDQARPIAPPPCRM
eukprot:5282908-Prymnesium_polylepis.1